MIVLALAVAQAAMNMPPCKGGKAECKPWDREWANAFDAPPTPFDGPAKLVVTWHEAGLVTVDYPSQSRCEKARSFVEAEVRRRYFANQAAMPPGAVTVGIPANGAFCIPA